MFCYQRSFGLPTEPVTAERFWALVRAPQTSELIDGYRETGDAALKRKLPAFIFQATFEETTSKTGKLGAWRKQAATCLTGLVVMDIDHVESEELRVKNLLPPTFRRRQRNSAFCSFILPQVGMV